MAVLGNSCSGLPAEALAGVRLPQAFFCKSPARSAFQVRFKLCRPLPALERKIDFQFPWHMLCCVRRSSPVVLCYPGFQITRQTCINLVRMFLAADEIHVMHKFQNYCCSKPSFVPLPRDYGGQPSPRFRLASRSLGGGSITTSVFLQKPCPIRFSGTLQIVPPAPGS